MARKHGDDPRSDQSEGRLKVTTDLWTPESGTPPPFPFDDGHTPAEIRNLTVNHYPDANTFALSLSTRRAPKLGERFGGATNGTAVEIFDTGRFVEEVRQSLDSSGHEYELWIDHVKYGERAQEHDTRPAWTRFLLKPHHYEEEAEVRLLVTFSKNPKVSQQTLKLIVADPLEYMREIAPQSASHENPRYWFCLEQKQGVEPTLIVNDEPRVS